MDGPKACKCCNCIFLKFSAETLWSVNNEAAKDLPEANQ